MTDPVSPTAAAGSTAARRRRDAAQERGVACLEVEGLVVTYGSAAAVDGASVVLHSGETLALVGESGSGKTSLAMAIPRLLPSAGARIARGSIRLRGRELTALSEPAMRLVRRREVRVIFQEPQASLNPARTVGWLLREAMPSGTSSGTGHLRAKELLAAVGITDAEARLGAYPHQLSGGMCQRVMIAMALAANPQLLIADEPTSALDVTVQAQLLRLLVDVRRQTGMSTLIISHDLGVASAIADRVAVMYAGQLVEVGPTAAVLGRPEMPYTEALLRSMPQTATATRQHTLAAIPGGAPAAGEELPGCRFAPRCRYNDGARCEQDPPALRLVAADHSARCWYVASARDASPADAATQSDRHATQTRGQTAGKNDFVLRIEHLYKSFPVRSPVLRRHVGSVQAVRGVSLSITRGRTLAVVGESGCGKSTLARCIVRLEQPTSGLVLLGGQDMSTLSGRELNRVRTQVQMVFQNPYQSLDPRMTVAQSVAEPLRIHGVGSYRQRRARVADVLAAVGLGAGFGSRYPHQLSGGQRQRVAIARALVVEPGLIILDEPVSALDTSVQAQVLQVLRDLQVQRGVSYLLIAHDLGVVRHVATDVAVMYLGKIVEEGPVDRIFAAPRHPYTAALLAATPRPAAESVGTLPEGLPGELPSVMHPPSGCSFRTRCPSATDICAATSPRLERTADSRAVACFHPRED